MKISYGSNVYGAKEIKEVVKQLKTGTQMGKSVENFENKISKLFRKKKTLLVNSGSSALILSFQSLDFNKGSNFITPVLTFGTLVSSMMMAGYVPNFIDVDSETLCIDEKKIEKKINKKTVGMCIKNIIGNLQN